MLHYRLLQEVTLLELAELRKAWGITVCEGLNPCTREGLVGKERWNLTVMMSTAKNQKFFVKKLRGPLDKELSNYLLIRCEQRQGNLHSGRRG